MMRIFLGLLITILVSSCGKESKESVTITRLISHIENYKAGTKGKTEITYFVHDLLGRVTQVVTYKIDSTGATLDSALIDSLTYRYIDRNLQPDYAESYRRLPAGMVLIRTYFSYEGGKLIRDSSYGDYLVPVLKSPASSNVRSYGYGENEIYCRNLRLEKTVSIDNDTSIIKDGNIVSNVYRHSDKNGKFSGVSSITKVTYDDMINPVRIPFPRHTRLSGNHINANNIVALNYRGDDSMAVISKFNYDHEGYPQTENYVVKHYFPQRPKARYIRRYYYKTP